MVTEENVRGFEPQWGKPDIVGLAELCKELFAWDSKYGMCRFMRSFTLIWPMIHEREVFTDGKKMEEKMSSNATKKPAATATNHTTKGKETKGGGE